MGGSAGRPPVDDAHGVRVCERLTHLVKVEERLQVGNWDDADDERCETKKTHARVQKVGGCCGNLLIREVRAFADLAVDSAAQVAELHVSDGQKTRCSGYAGKKW